MVLLYFRVWLSHKFPKNVNFYLSNGGLGLGLSLSLGLGLGLALGLGLNLNLGLGHVSLSLTREPLVLPHSDFYATYLKKSGKNSILRICI